MKSLALALALSVGAAAAPALKPTATSTPTATPAPAPTPVAGWIVVQRDGSRVPLVREPVRKGSLLVGNLFPEGSLVSIRVEEVDEEKTAAANRDRRTSLDASPAYALPQNVPALGDKVKSAPRIGPAAAREDLDAARRALADAVKERDRFKKQPPPESVEARAAWERGLKLRNRAVDDARLRVARARKRVEELDGAAR